MAQKYHIYTNQEDIDNLSEEQLEAWIDSTYDDKTFIICEDGENLLTNDSGESLMTMEFGE